MKKIHFTPFIIAATVASIFLIALGLCNECFGYQQPDTGPKLCLYDVRPQHIYTRNDRMEIYEQMEVQKYDMICSAFTPFEANLCKSINPNMINIYQMAFGGTPDASKSVWWEVPDTTWSIEALSRWYVNKNLERSVDWKYKDIYDQDIPLIWNKNMCNFTSYCPKGKYGNSNNLTYLQWVTYRAFPSILNNPQFRNNWDGLMFDTYPTISSWDIRWKNVDYNYDHVADDHYGKPPYDCEGARNHPWTNQKIASLNVLFNYLLSYQYHNPNFILMYGQDAVCFENSKKFNGWKIENWYFQPGASRVGNRWQNFWDGNSNTTGYYEAESRFTNGVDSKYGWDMSIIHMQLPENWSMEQKRRMTRYGLGTSMLGDGFFAVCDTKNGNVSYFIAPEMNDWKVLLPAKTDMYKVPDPSHKGVDRFCRLYDGIDGKPVTVVVDTLNCDAYFFNYNYGPGRKAKITRKEMY